MPPRFASQLPSFMIIFFALRLGRYVAKVPHAVVSGFSCGVGAMMVILQLRTFLGLPALPSAKSLSSLGQLAQVLSNANHTRWEPLLMGSIVVVGAILIARDLAALASGLARRRCGRRRGILRSAGTSECSARSP